MSTLAEWLLEQIAHDERIAVAARDAPPDFLEVGSAEEQHLITLMDYDRVLAECDAKRRIVADLDRKTEDLGILSSTANRLMAHLALPYADRPGYVEEWRP